MWWGRSTVCAHACVGTANVPQSTTGASWSKVRVWTYWLLTLWLLMLAAGLLILEVLGVVMTHQTVLGLEVPA